MNKKNNNDFLYCRTVVKRKSDYDAAKTIHKLFGGSLEEEKPEIDIEDGGEIYSVQSAIRKSDIVGFNEVFEDIVPKSRMAEYCFIVCTYERTYCANISFDNMKEIMEKYDAEK